MASKARVQTEDVRTRTGIERRVLCATCGCCLWSSATSAFAWPPADVGDTHKCMTNRGRP